MAPQLQLDLHCNVPEQLTPGLPLELTAQECTQVSLARSAEVDVAMRGLPRFLTAPYTQCPGSPMLGLTW